MTPVVAIRDPVRAALREVQREVGRLYGPHLEALVLFGSQARGEAHVDSDIDVLVVLDDIDDWIVETRRLASLVGPVLEHHGELVSFKVTTRLDYARGATGFLRTVRAEGVPVDVVLAA